MGYPAGEAWIDLAVDAAAVMRERGGRGLGTGCAAGRDMERRASRAATPQPARESRCLARRHAHD